MQGRNVILVGFMGAGKSVCGRMLAKRLGRCFVETDDMITAREGCAIPEIFARHGEARFRQLETEAVEALALKSDDVVATGGGLPCRDGMMDTLRSLGTVVWLRGDLRDLLERARRQGARPMLHGRSDDDVAALYRAREPFYREAHLTIDTSGRTIDQVVGDLVAALREVPMPQSADPSALSAAAAREAIKNGTLSPVALVDACLARIRALDPKLQAWIHVDEAGARTQAALREEEAKSGKLRGPLHGIPIGIKDIFDVEGMPTTAGAKAWAHRHATQDASSVQRLRNKGAIILGKTHTTQFAFRDPAPTRNPWNVEHTPGGSSSGSAAAVAARMVPFALGSQTVGSVLRPAAYCGVVGYKPPHGVIAADGVVPLAWSLDHVGVFARSVIDLRLVAEAYGLQYGIAVHRPARLAIAPELLARAEPDVAASVQAAARAFAQAGASVDEVKLPPSFAEIHEAGQLILESEAAAYHEPSFAKHSAEYGEGIRAMVQAGLTRPAVAYVRADRTRRRFREEAARVLASYDALISPTAPALPPRGLTWTGDASLCAPWSSAGFPSISLPTGVAASGLPNAVQLVAVPERNEILLYFAAWCEEVLGFTAAPV